MTANSAMPGNFKKSEFYLHTPKSNAECFSHDVSSSSLHSRCQEEFLTSN